MPTRLATLAYRPATLRRVALAAVFLCLAALPVVLMFDPDEDWELRDTSPLVFVALGIPALLFLLAASRELVALFRRPHLLLSLTGAEARVSRGLLPYGFLLPAQRMVEYAFAWPELAGIEVARRSLGKFSVATGLMLTTTRGPILIRSGQFSLGPKALSASILDYLAAEPGRRTAADVVPFQQLRWRAPHSHPFEADRPWLPWTALAGAIVLSITSWVLSRQNGEWVAWPMVPVPVLVFIGVAMAAANRVCARTRHVELGSAGVRIGRDRAGSVLVAWEDIALVRPHLSRRLLRRGPAVTALEIRRNSGKPLWVRRNGATGAALLYEFLEPDSAAASAALVLASRGEEIEASAVAAGLTPRP